MVYWDLIDELLLFANQLANGFSTCRCPADSRASFDCLTSAVPVAHRTVSPNFGILRGLFHFHAHLKATSTNTQSIYVGSHLGLPWRKLTQPYVTHDPSLNTNQATWPIKLLLPPPNMVGFHRERAVKVPPHNSCASTKGGPTVTGCPVEPKRPRRSLLFAAQDSQRQHSGTATGAIRSVASSGFPWFPSSCAKEF